MFYLIGYTFFWLLVRGIFRLQSYGTIYIPQKGKVIIAPNHISNLDPPFIGAALKRKIYFLAKEELFRISIFGRILERVNAIPIKRGRYSTNTLKKVMEVLNKGEGVLIFPEGTRSRDGNFGKAKLGIGMLAVKTKAPVLPVLIENTDNFFKLKSVRIRFGKLLYYDNLQENKETYEIVSKDILERIKMLKSVS